LERIRHQRQVITRQEYDSFSDQGATLLKYLVDWLLTQNPDANLISIEVTTIPAPDATPAPTI
jgi:hypothetical protein